MKRRSYRVVEREHHGYMGKRHVVYILLIIVITTCGYAYWRHGPSNKSQGAVTAVRYGITVDPSEKVFLEKALKLRPKSFYKTANISVKTELETQNTNLVLSVYVPVTNIYSSVQGITKTELAKMPIYILTTTDETTRAMLTAALGLKISQLLNIDSLDKLAYNAVAFVPLEQLSSRMKLLALDGNYYLDNFQNGAVFRQAQFKGPGARSLNKLKLNSYPDKTTTMKVNMSGTTALTRKFIIKVKSVPSPTYFSKLIGHYLADADITHVSNEVSFKSNCQVDKIVFCASAEMIDVLKSSGVNLVELTGNHNNDVGATSNAEAINLYHSLGWHTFGGGINSVEAAKPYVTDIKNSKVAFLGYNAADSSNSGAIATATEPGANHFDFDKIKADVASAKQQANFVIVDVQYLECYAYPEGYVEYPICDQPIAHQAEDFHRLIDLGADMVIGTQAHHPQTFEIYKGKPIYYGLGNLYFDQVEWPGTERGMILSHYFVNGTLLQTKLSPTVYDKDLQTHLMNNTDASKFLNRLSTARSAAGL